jgi:hypothetical protein
MVEQGNDRVDPRLGEGLRKAANRAVEEAKARGSATVEAEHLLLAVAAEPGLAADVLAEAGLDHDAIGVVLDAERRESLAVAGIAGPLAELPATPRDGRPAWGSSAREALRRAAIESRGAAGRGRDRNPRRRGPDEGDLVIGVLGADLGTVPRALAYAGIVPRPIIQRLRAAATTA